MSETINKKRNDQAQIEMRPATFEDFDAILKLNQDLVHFLSPLSKEKLTHLHSQAEIHSVVVVDGIVQAFIIAFREGKDYDSVNYTWFCEHYEKFLYVDRVVVSVAMQGAGLGSMIYNEIFKHAQKIEVPFVTAEIDFEPPNPNSLKFHEKYGFKEVGRQSVYGGKKIVSLQAAEIS